MRFGRTSEGHLVKETWLGKTSEGHLAAGMWFGRTSEGRSGHQNVITSEHSLSRTDGKRGSRPKGTHRGTR
ncbi:MAG: hypothetical protein K9G46_01310 [Flavobacteriales bacterium]|nr:hypothetical protein [Flavobacteriales bacterium]